MNFALINGVIAAIQNLSAAWVTSGRFGKDRLQWTNAKLLLGAGAAADPTEIDVPAAATKEFFIPIVFGSGVVAGILGNAFASWAMADGGDYVASSFKVPHDFVSLTSLKVIGIKVTNGTIDWTALTQFGAVGEAFNTHTDTDTGDGLAMLTNEIEEVNLSNAIDGIVADDFVGLIFTLDAISAGGYYVLGFVFKYA